MPEFEFKCAPARRPIIEIEISSPREESGTPIKTWAWIDTGADITTISKKISDRLDLIPLHSAETKTHVAGGELVDCTQYLANIKLIISKSQATYNCGLNKVQVLNSDRDVIPCLIGINLLEKGKFTFDGRNAQFSLTFPD
jgi:predicted aspartyl protease